MARLKHKEKIVIIGAGEFGEIACEYFTYDSSYEVVAFSVEKEFLNRTELMGRPVVPFEEVEKKYSPSGHKVFVAVTHTKLNRVRKKFYQRIKEKGFSAVSYVSSRAFVWRTVEMGENCFIFENNVVQHGVKLGNNIILWSGNHIGHQTKIEDHCYISSHVVISGYCEIGESCFLGVNSSFSEGIKIARDCIIGNGAVVIRNTEEGKVYVGNPAKALSKNSYETFGVEKDLK